ncbi:MAG: ectoine hydroxylase [Alphaproteobacteria bacterium]|nr:ectoine hydroxylase [Alphaproteobacteria bacterium]MDX5464625.1 ectoine hydroxylase [Alphaproteobacteria bacterium]
MRHVEDLYPTRKDDREHIVDRRDPVIWGDTEASLPRALPRDRLERFARDGYLVVPDVFSQDEVALMQAELDRLAADPDVRAREEAVLEPDSEIMRSLFAPHRFSPLFDRVARDRRLTDPIRQMLADDLYLHHARVNVKPAFDGRSFAWHSDFETWHAEDGLPRMRAVTGWIMLTENTPSNGPLMLIPGSHKIFVGCPGETPDDNYKSSLRRQKLGVPHADTLRDMARKGGIAGAYGKPGTVVFHECNTLHGSPDNMSPWDRRNLMFVYNAWSNRPAPRPFSARKPRPAFLSERPEAPLVPADGPLVQA